MIKTYGDLYDKLKDEEKTLLGMRIANHYLKDFDIAGEMLKEAKKKLNKEKN